jgi:hypothetical protein
LHSEKGLSKPFQPNLLHHPIGRLLKPKPSKPVLKVAFDLKWLTKRVLEFASKLFDFIVVPVVESVGISVVNESPDKSALASTPLQVLEEVGDVFKVEFFFGYLCSDRARFLVNDGLEPIAKCFFRKCFLFILRQSLSNSLKPIVEDL